MGLIPKGSIAQTEYEIADAVISARYQGTLERHICGRMYYEPNEEGGHQWLVTSFVPPSVARADVWGIIPVFTLPGETYADARARTMREAAQFVIGHMAGFAQIDLSICDVEVVEATAQMPLNFLTTNRGKPLVRNPIAPGLVEQKRQAGRQWLPDSDSDADEQEQEGGN